MDKKFALLVEALDPKLQRLVAMAAVRDGNLPPSMPKSGVYLFSEKGEHLYVGRSNDFRGRYGLHCRNSAGHNAASFAFKLARRVTGLMCARVSSPKSAATSGTRD